MQGFLEELKARNVRLVAISVDPPDVSKKHAAKQGYTFPILSDEKLEVLRKYDLVHEGGFRGADISKPAEFFLDADGKIVWRNLTDDYKVRLTAEQLRKGLDALGVARYSAALDGMTGPPRTVVVPEPILSNQLAGTVVDPSGVPIPGTDVSRLELGSEKIVQIVESDRDGGFNFPNAPCGQYRLRFEASGFDIKIVTVHTCKSEGNLRIALPISPVS